MQTGVLRAAEGKAYWVAGDLYRCLAAGEDTGGAYALIHAEVPPGGGPPPHLHRREDEAFFVLEGELECEAAGRTFTAGAGAWVTLPRGNRHRFTNKGATPARMLIIVNPAGLEKYFQEAGREAVDRSAAEGAFTPADLQRLLAVAPKYGLEIAPPG